jgi:hypothetical protein
LTAAAVPSTVVNWVGDEIVNDAEMYAYLGALAGVAAKIEIDDSRATPLFAADPSQRKSITGPTQVSWKAGLLKTLKLRFPEHKFPEVPVLGAMR